MKKGQEVQIKILRIPKEERIRRGYRLSEVQEGTILTVTPYYSVFGTVDDTKWRLPYSHSNSYILKEHCLVMYNLSVGGELL